MGDDDVEYLTQQQITEELEAKVVFLLDTFNLWSEDGHFTFPDGDTWERRKESDDG